MSDDIPPDSLFANHTPTMPEPLLGVSQRMPPSNPQAEQAFLGAMLANSRSVVNKVIDFLKPEHFSDALHGRIYREICRRVLDGGVGDAVTLQAWMAADPQAPDVGGSAYLSQLLVAMVAIINAKEYALAIFDAWQRREAIAAGTDFVNEAFSPSREKPVSTLVSSMVDRLDRITDGNGIENKPAMFDEAMDDAISAMESAMRGETLPGVPTGMRLVDSATGGLERATLTILAARPGMGKSALGAKWGLNVAIDAARRHPVGQDREGVVFFSLEMRASQIARRLLSAESGIPAEAIRFGRLNQVDVDSIIAARRRLAGLPLSIVDTSGLSMGAIRIKARQAKRRHGLGLIVVDHLHIVRPEDVDNRNGSTAAIGKISNGLKQLAKEFDVPVLALAQLSRALESREDKRPTLNDLRQSGEIEQDADTVAFLYRGEYYLPKGEPERLTGESEEKFKARRFALDEQRVRLKGKAELILEKLREGSPRTIHLTWKGVTTSFDEPSQDEFEP